MNELTHAQYIDQNLQVIANQSNLNKNDLDFFAIQCKRTGLDPITRQIYAMPQGGKLTIMASIDGLRLIAERTGKYQGQTKPEWCGKDGKWVDVWLEDGTPSAARIGVWKENFREPTYGVAKFSEFNKANSQTWRSMPTHMLSKVAESLALRKAFPNEMSGIYTPEEMDQATNSAPREVNTEAAIDGHNSEKKHITEKISDLKKETQSVDLANYTVQCGKKYAGMKLSEMKDFEIAGYLKYLDEGVSKNGKPLSGAFLEFHQNATAYLASLPKVDESDSMNF